MFDLSANDATAWIVAGSVFLAIILGALSYVGSLAKWYFRSLNVGVAIFAFLGFALISTPKWTEIAVTIGDFKLNIAELEQKYEAAVAEVASLEQSRQAVIAKAAAGELEIAELRQKYEAAAAEADARSSQIVALRKEYEVLTAGVVSQIAALEETLTAPAMSQSTDYATLVADLKQALSGETIGIAADVTVWRPAADGAVSAAILAGWVLRIGDRIDCPDTAKAAAAVETALAMRGMRVVASVQLSDLRKDGVDKSSWLVGGVREEAWPQIEMSYFEHIQRLEERNTTNTKAGVRKDGDRDKVQN